jgi:hypothetical protein
MIVYCYCRRIQLRVDTVNCLSALRSLENKREISPRKKHGNIPL